MFGRCGLPCHFLVDAIRWRCGGRWYLACEVGTCTPLAKPGHRGVSIILYGFPFRGSINMAFRGSRHSETSSPQTARLRTILWHREALCAFYQLSLKTEASTANTLHKVFALIYVHFTNRHNCAPSLIFPLFNIPNRALTSSTLSAPFGAWCLKDSPGTEHVHRVEGLEGWRIQ